MSDYVLLGQESQVRFGYVSLGQVCQVVSMCKILTGYVRLV
jgi:hypothetical protein